MMRRPIRLSTTMGNFLRYATGRSGLASLSSRLVHSPQSLRVLMYHDVPDSLVSHFKSHLAWLSQRFEFVRPSDLLRETQVSRRPKLLLTFDDGCADNYELVAPLLESYDARGLFFVCPGFADQDREQSSRLMERSAAALGESNRDSRWQRLSRAQIVELDQRGHGIGSHTLTHVPLAHISEPEAALEVKQSAELLASWLGHDCYFFSWTYSWDEITAHSLKVAMGHHRFCFSPCSGLNSWPPPPRLLARTGVDVSKPVSDLQTQLSGLQDLAYKSKREWLWRLWSSVSAA
jgi:peptidoglycan/xylan/chitin deacetylase (PgdA/CDA1 family)